MLGKKVRILVFAGLSNRSLEAFTSLLLQVDSVHLDVIRISAGTPDSRITYHFPSFTVANSTFLIILWKIFMTIKLLLTVHFDAIYAIFNIPHLFIAYLASIISRRPLIYSVIAGITEFERTSKLIEKICGMIMRNIQFILVHMDSTVEYLTKNYGIARKKIIQYPMFNKIVNRDFYPLNLEKTLDLVVVSMLLPDKHIEVFIDIVERLKISFPNITAGIVGKGRLYDFLEEYTHSKQLTENITFFGYVSVQQLNRILNSAQIFVLNSSHEGGPITIIEAMNTGVVCVASRVGQVPIRIKHGYNGFIVNRYDDIDKYLDIIHNLLSNPDLLSTLQRNAAESKNTQSKKGLWFWRTLLIKMLHSKNE